MESELQKLREKAEICIKCDKLVQNRNNVVFGEGAANAKILLIGEAPGEQEDLTGRPFCGRAGKILDEILEALGIERKNVYITSILKCRPPNNRYPHKDEIKNCKSFLDGQLRLISPKITIIMGNCALESILGKKKISEEHGKIIEKNGVTYLITYHPAAVLYNKKLFQVIQDDLRILKKLAEK